MASNKEVLGNDVNMMPGFLVIGLACFGMIYGAQAATWIEMAKDDSEWIFIAPARSAVRYVEDK